jgi:cell division protease FtsH
LPPQKPSFLGQRFLWLLPVILILGLMVFIMRRAQGGAVGAGVMGVGKSRARQFEANAVKIALAEVAGVEEAREEFGEAVDFLKDPGKSRDVGGTISRGVLVVGPPGKLMNGRERRPPEQSNDRRGGSARRPIAGSGTRPRPTGIPAP